VRKIVPALVADRRQDRDIERVLALYRTGELRIDASLGDHAASRDGDRCARDAKAPRLHETRVELDVPFHHVDALGIVWHGHYPKYFAAAGMALLRKLALDGGELIGERYRLVVIETACRHGVSAALCRSRRRHRVDRRLRAAPGDPLRRAQPHPRRRAAHGHTTLATLDAGRAVAARDAPPRSSARDPRVIE
jgi:acyl-CoA thioester hydrolase